MNKQINILATPTGFGNYSRDLRKKYSKKFNFIIFNISDPKKIYQIIKEKKINCYIAGTEEILSEAYYAKTLNMICRFGIGMDNINFELCKKNKIFITSTPDAPSNAVAELVISNIINCLRGVSYVDKVNRKKKWYRYLGKEISEANIGIICFGRIGKLVYSKLKRLGCKNVKICEIDKKKKIFNPKIFVNKNFLLKNCDVITLHIPYNKKNKNFINKNDLSKVQRKGVLINTSRGGIINERALLSFLNKNKLFQSAIDVFENEPNINPAFFKLDNCLITSHMGSMSSLSRKNMEEKILFDLLNFYTPHLSQGK